MSIPSHLIFSIIIMFPIAEGDETYGQLGPTTHSHVAGMFPSGEVLGKTFKVD